MSSYEAIVRSVAMSIQARVYSNRVDLHTAEKQKEYRTKLEQYESKPSKLRNVVWPISQDLVIGTQDNSVVLADCARGLTSVVADVGSNTEHGRVVGIGPVVISTMSVGEGLLAVGGLQGELLIGKLDGALELNAMRRSTFTFQHALRVSQSENSISNAIELYRTPGGSTRLLLSNNDSNVRDIDVETGTVISCYPMDWSVNYASAHPLSRDLFLVAGDDPASVLIDARSKQHVSKLYGHLDFSFAAGWAPDGNYLATGNQDLTTRIWDARYLARSLHIISAKRLCCRSLRWSPCGRLLALAEEAFNITVLDAASNYARMQQWPVLKDVIGFGWDPSGATLSAGVVTSSLEKYNGGILQLNAWGAGDAAEADKAR